MSYVEELHDATERAAALAAPGRYACLPAEDTHAAMAAAGDLVTRAQAVHTALAAHFTALGAFRADGATDTAAWLRANSRLSGRSAKQSADAARAMTSLPDVGDAIRRGTASVEHAALLAPLADAVAAGAVDTSLVVPLVAAAAHDTPDVFRQRVRAAELAARADGGNAQAVRQRDNSNVRIFDGDDAMRVIRAELDPERHAIVCNSIDAIVDEHWRTRHPDTTGRPPTRELPKLRADALVDMARRSITRPSPTSRGTSQRGEPQVVVHLDHRSLVEGILRRDSVCHLDDGTPIPAETARRIACDAAIIPVVLGGPTRPLDVGRASRLATPAQRVALRARSTTCEFAGCTIPAAWAKAHHLRWWEHGGRTDLDNMCLVCERHHHLVHEGGWAFERVDGITYTRRPDGTYHGPAPPLAARP